MPEFRRNGFGPKVSFYTMEQVVKDERVKNKKHAYSEARLEMIPFWKKRAGDKLRTIGPVYVGGNGLE